MRGIPARYATGWAVRVVGADGMTAIGAVRATVGYRKADVVAETSPIRSYRRRRCCRRARCTRVRRCTPGVARRRVTAGRDSSHRRDRPRERELRFDVRPELTCDVSQPDTLVPSGELIDELLRHRSREPRQLHRAGLRASVDADDRVGLHFLCPVSPAADGSTSCPVPTTRTRCTPGKSTATAASTRRRPQHRTARRRSATSSTRPTETTTRPSTARLRWREYAEDMGNDPARDGGTPDPLGGTRLRPSPDRWRRPHRTGNCQLTSTPIRHNPFIYFHSVIDDQSRVRCPRCPLGHGRRRDSERRSAGHLHAAISSNDLQHTGDDTRASCSSHPTCATTATTRPALDQTPRAARRAASSARICG